MSDVIIGRLKKTSEMLDKFGNVIDPITKQIIRKAEKEEQVTPPPKPEEPKKENNG